MNLAAPIRAWMPPALYKGYLDGLPDIIAFVLTNLMSYVGQGGAVT